MERFATLFRAAAALRQKEQVSCALPDYSDFVQTNAPNIFSKPGVSLENSTIVIDGDSAVFLGSRIYVIPEIRVTGNNNVVILCDGCCLNSTMILVTANNSIVVVGKDTFIASATMILAGDNQHILIGDTCLFSQDVLLRTDDGHGIFDLVTKERLNPPRPVVIGAHVWIGFNAKINKGCRIGEGSVLGQMSVASGVLDGNCVYAGAPARKIRSRIAWSHTDAWDFVSERDKKLSLDIESMRLVESAQEDVAERPHPAGAQAVLAAITEFFVRYRVFPISEICERIEIRKLRRENFDADFYASTNWDVKRDGDNPLLHYIRHGRSEGRRIRFKKKEAFESSKSLQEQ